MVSGDLVSHTVWAYTPETHSFMVKNLSDTIRSYFPKTPVYFAVGNHEGVPVDKWVNLYSMFITHDHFYSIAPHFTPKKYHMDWLYKAMSNAWQGWIPADQEKSLE